LGFKNIGENHAIKRGFSQLVCQQMGGGGSKGEKGGKGWE